MEGFVLPHVLETPRFSVTPCYDCDVPGYLIVQPRQSSGTLIGLEQQTQHDLGQILARVEAAVLHVTDAERVYILRFSEGLASVHFHIFPRSREIAKDWIAAQPEAAADGINGPLLFAWARIRHHVDMPTKLSKTTLATAVKINAELHRIKD